jgi:hypothetical protein
MKSVFDGRDWRPPADGARIETIDMHTGGEPLRVFTPGASNSRLTSQIAL